MTTAIESTSHPRNTTTTCLATTTIFRVNDLVWAATGEQHSETGTVVELLLPPRPDLVINGEDDDTNKQSDTTPARLVLPPVNRNEKNEEQLQLQAVLEVRVRLHISNLIMTFEPHQLQHMHDNKNNMDDDEHDTTGSSNNKTRRSTRLSRSTTGRSSAATTTSSATTSSSTSAAATPDDSEDDDDEDDVTTTASRTRVTSKEVPSVTTSAGQQRRLRSRSVVTPSPRGGGGGLLLVKSSNNKKNDDDDDDRKPAAKRKSMSRTTTSTKGTTKKQQLRLNRSIKDDEDVNTKQSESRQDEDDDGEETSRCTNSSKNKDTTVLPARQKGRNQAKKSGVTTVRSTRHNVNRTILAVDKNDDDEDTSDIITIVSSSVDDEMNASDDYECVTSKATYKRNVTRSNKQPTQKPESSSSKKKAKLSEIPVETTNKEVKEDDASLQDTDESDDDEEEEENEENGVNDMIVVNDDDGENDRPYLAEYAPSGRAMCRRCDQIIAKGMLRISHAPLFRGKPGFRVYRHLECAIFSQEIQTMDDVGGCRQLQPNDQELVSLRIEESKVEVLQENEELEPDELVQTAFAGEMRTAPPGLSGNLLPFQKEGVSWMYHQEVHVPEIRGGILADEMGMVRLTLYIFCLENGTTLVCSNLLTCLSYAQLSM